MLHPSYSELINAFNSEVAEGEEPVVNSRYSIVIATAKRARQLVAGEEPLVMADEKKKPLSIAVDELYNGQVKILPEDGLDEDGLEMDGFDEDGLEIESPEAESKEGEESLMESAWEDSKIEPEAISKQALSDAEEPVTEGIPGENA